MRIADCPFTTRPLNRSVSPKGDSWSPPGIRRQRHRALVSIHHCRDVVSFSGVGTAKRGGGTLFHGEVKTFTSPLILLLFSLSYKKMTIGDIPHWSPCCWVFGFESHAETLLLQWSANTSTIRCPVTVSLSFCSPLRPASRFLQCSRGNVAPYL